MLKRLILIPLLSFLERRPAWAFLALLLYLFLPIDLLPEGLLGLAGYMDDVVVLAAGLALTGYLRRRRRRKKEGAVIDTTAEVRREEPPGPENLPGKGRR